MSDALRVVMGTVFFPRGGSAFAIRALARGLRDEHVDVTLVAGSRTGGGSDDARSFYAGLDVRPVDVTPAPGADEAPAQLAFEHRPGAADRAFAELDDRDHGRQVRAWARELAAAGAADADVLHLHHLTPLNAAADVVAPAVPVVTHLHGTELLMLEAIDAGASRRHGAAWAARLRDWAARADRLVLAPGNRDRALALFDVDPDRIVTLANGFDPAVFRPLDVDRRAVWRRVLADEPRGWRPGGEPGSVRYMPADVDALTRGPIVVYVGRFTGVKRLPLLLQAFARVRTRSAAPPSLVLVGGHPGEWEGEHPADAIERLGVGGVYLAGWHDQAELPGLLNASDLLVLPSARESLGQVIVEAMACGVPTVAAASLGPARLIEHGSTGWLFPVDEGTALADAVVDALARPDEGARRGRLARQVALERYTWPAIARRLAEILRDAAAPLTAPRPRRTASAR